MLIILYGHLYYKGKVLIKKKIRIKNNPYIHLEVKGEELDIEVGWEAGDDLSGFAEMITALATGALINHIIEAIEDHGEEEDINYIKNILDTNLRNLRDELQKEDDEDSPLVSPDNAMNHLISLYNNLNA